MTMKIFARLPKSPSANMPRCFLTRSDAVVYETRRDIECAKTDAKRSAGNFFAGWFVPIFFKPCHDIGYLGDQMRGPRVDRMRSLGDAH